MVTADLQAYESRRGEVKKGRGLGFNKNKALTLT